MRDQGSWHLEESERLGVLEVGCPPRPGVAEAGQVESAKESASHTPQASVCSIEDSMLGTWVCTVD